MTKDDIQQMHNVFDRLVALSQWDQAERDKIQQRSESDELTAAERDEALRQQDRKLEEAQS